LPCGSEIDIVLSDWIMPGHVRAWSSAAHSARSTGGSYGYFVLLTSKSEKEDVALGLDSGADDFLTKPVNSGELRARLRGRADRRHAGGAARQERSADRRARPAAAAHEGSTATFSRRGASSNR
jgi:DNA-binding response OmpR family regulator